MKNEKEIQDAGLIQQESKRGVSDSDRTTSQHDKSDGTIRYFSMFTGVGGFELGLENTESLQGRTRSTSHIQSKRNSPHSKGNARKSNKNYRCIGFSEIDKYASELLKQKFPTVKNWGDATKINSSELPDFDMLCGGFPCQAFSIAGKRRGFQDTRGTLFFDIARIVKVKRPKIVFLENVKGLLNHEKGQTFRVIIQTLSELGYDVQWMVLNSKFFGVPQNRERVFIIGSLRGTSRPEILPFGRINQETYGESKMNPQTLMDVNQAQRVYSTDGQSITLKGLGGGQGAKTGLYAMRSYLRNQSGMKNPNQKGHQNLELNKEGVTNTSSSVQKDNLWVEDMKIRRLTPRECEALQGFPQDWTEGFSDTQRYKMMGNAVTVNVIKAIGEKLNKEKRK